MFCKTSLFFFKENKKRKRKEPRFYTKDVHWMREIKRVTIKKCSKSKNWALTVIFCSFPLLYKMFKNAKLIYIIGFLIRLALFSFPSVTDTLSQRVELSTPVTSFKRRKLWYYCMHVYDYNFFSNSVTEGVFLYNSNIPPYDGGVFHQVNK